MPTIINADTATGGAIITGDTSGQLQLQSGGVTALTTTGANVAIAGSLTAAGGVTGVNLSASVTGTLGVANGGTGAATLTANSVLLGNGTSAVTAVAPGASGNVLTSNGTTWTSATLAGNSITATASGSISNGAPVIVNSNETVSAVAGAVGGFGTLSNFWFSGTWYAFPLYLQAIYSPQGQRIIIFWQDNETTGILAKTVAISSEGVLTYGSLQQVRTSSGGALAQRNYAAYNSDVQRVAVFYPGDSNTVRGRMCEISGSAINFSSESILDYLNGNPTAISASYNIAAQRYVVPRLDSVFNTAFVMLVSGTATSLSVVANAALPAGTNSTTSVYDVNAQRTVLFYGSVAVVCTITSSSISLNTPVSFGGSSSQNSFSAVYHEDAQKIVVAYQASGGGMVARVGTVSGTTISFGSPVTIEATGASPAITYDSVSKRVVVVYTVNGTTARFAVGTVSGTNIVFTTPVTYASGFVSIQSVTVASEPINQRSLLCYSTYVQDAYGLGGGYPYQIPYTNLTASNFIGFSNAAYTNGQTATVQTVGAVDDAQAGLTAGQGYYVTNSGALSTTAGSPSVFAGTALSASRILVKG